MYSVRRLTLRSVVRSMLKSFHGRTDAIICTFGSRYLLPSLDSDLVLSPSYARPVLVLRLGT